MKVIIYAGIGLFSTASIFGVADYYHSENKGELKNLYTESSNLKPQNSIAGIKEKEINLEDYSRAKIEESMENINEENSFPNTKLIEKPTVAVSKKKNYKRKIPKIKLSDFSRSRLVINEKIPVALTDSSTEKY